MLKKIISLAFCNRKAYRLRRIFAKPTLRCNLKCKQCWGWREENNRELDTDTWKKIILNVKQFVGPYSLRFYGGEPFLRKDLLNLLSFCLTHNIVTLITTNGTLINKDIAEELVQAQVACINISLDGIKPETHDKLRGVPGTYCKVIDAIGYLQGKMPLGLYTTIMQDNLDEILALTDFAIKNKLRISFNGISHYFNDKTRPVSFPNSCLCPTDLKKADCVLDELIRRKQRTTLITNSTVHLRHLKMYFRGALKLKKRRCEVIFRKLKIGSKGEVCLCFFSKPVGNLVSQSLRDVWKSNAAKYKISEMKNCDNYHCLAIRCMY